MNAPMVVRVGAGALRSSGPHHSGIYHPIFAHMPGLIVCVPSTPADAKGLMKTALRAGDPVIMLEPKALFASKGEVPVGRALCAVRRRAHRARRHRHHHRRRRPDGAARARGGGGPGGRRASRPRSSIRARSCRSTSTRSSPSVRKTHRLLVVDEGWAMCGLGAEIAQAINELAFDELDAPPGRLHTAPTSHPFAPVLERAMLVDAARIVQGARDVIAGVPPVPDHWYTVGIKSAAPAKSSTRPRPSRLPAADACAGRRHRATTSRSPCRSATSPSAKAP